MAQYAFSTESKHSLVAMEISNKLKYKKMVKVNKGKTPKLVLD